jgi:hypothetical protein
VTRRLALVAAGLFSFASLARAAFNAEIYGPGNYRQYPIEPRFVFGWLRWAF